MVELYASVITGFENVSSREINSTLNADASKGRGHVRFELDYSRIPEALHLRSIDNLYAVLYDYDLEGLTSAPMERVKRLHYYTFWRDGRRRTMEKE
ncbi:hypothetical protein OESDEN_18501 [Oesophagostomum dentatum]|uniref:Uncharacterized protein n=1 Tax=Oesophagostomum dentatum TaxID=61180 RepID=A0A0B1SF24_OESDE|nr:hypothetical protein OESDEN_18501 [Oesophagostomum dentatum]